MARQRLPVLPKLLARKLYKTGQTRGADDDEIYQNRVLRTSTVLIPYPSWPICKHHEKEYENGFIVLISPTTYFATPKIEAELAAQDLELGRNALVFYETREQWNANNPARLGWEPAKQRLSPLGGQYVARVPATTSMETGEKINHGFTTTSKKGAGVRGYEYASSAVLKRCRLQLEGLFWLCADADAIAMKNGMTQENTNARKTAVIQNCTSDGLLDMDKLEAARAINGRGVTICPLCLEVLSGEGFFNRTKQAEGREVLDLTITQVSLFHIEELRYGVLNHQPYNVAWGHHHCNVVARDWGIMNTLQWMKSVLDRNIKDGLFTG